MRFERFTIRSCHVAAFADVRCFSHFRRRQYFNKRLNLAFMTISINVTQEIRIAEAITAADLAVMFIRLINHTNANICQSKKKFLAE